MDENTSEEKNEFNKTAVSPLADPMVENIYKDLKVGGLAAESFISAVLSECGENLGNIIKLETQARQKVLGHRGCRVDVLAKSDTNRIILQEVQLYFEPSIYNRNVLAASNWFVNTARVGTKPEVMALEMPYIFIINILGHIKNCRTDNKEIAQPINFLYRKSPSRVAFLKFAVFDVQLPRVPDAAEDFSNNFYCWCRLFHEMHFNSRQPEEVFMMVPGIKEFVERDAGAKQFTERYTELAADPEIRLACNNWLQLQLEESGLRQGAFEEGEEIGLAKGEKIGLAKGEEIGLAKGKEITLKQIIHQNLENNKSLADIAKMCGLPVEEVQRLAGL